MTRWAMVADLERCVGCQTCTAACRHANATAPAVQWRKVLDVEAGSYPSVSRTFVPVGCQHCADPPCMHVCPTGATGRRADGIVTIDYDLCIGCAYCDVACPYQARFKVDAPRFAYGDAAMENESEREDPRRLGVAQKCNFCSDRIDFGLANALVPGLDPRATPACVNACIADALHFGDLDDEDSNVSRLLREQRHFRMHEELATQPGFYYVNGGIGEPVHNGSDPTAPSAQPGKLRNKGAEPAHQQHWDWKAASNFVCGGAGIGLFLFAAVVGRSSLLPLGSLALAIVAFGLLLLLFKIGRPWRFVYVLRQPRRSWMAREAWIAVAFFPLAALAIWFETLELVIAAAATGMLFLLSQAMILREARGIPAWRSRLMVPLIMATGIAEGAGLFLAGAALLPSLVPAAPAVAVAAVMLAGLRGWIWRLYLSALQVEGAPSRTLAVLSTLSPWFFLVGLAVPSILTVVGLAVTDISLPVFAVAGICIFVSGGTLKLILVTRAGFNQGFALPQAPARGSEVTGPAIKPG